jgi:hypothetical protein
MPPLLKLLALRADPLIGTKRAYFPYHSSSLGPQTRIILMRKPLPEPPTLTEEETVTEMIELTCDEVDALSRAFTMISQLCDELQHEVLAESFADIPDGQIN